VCYSLYEQFFFLVTQTFTPNNPPQPQALNLKNIAYEYRAVNLLKDEQYSEEHLQRNAIGSVPVLFIDNVHLAQSVSFVDFNLSISSIMAHFQWPIGVTTF